MRISDWSSDVCSSDLEGRQEAHAPDRQRGDPAVRLPRRPQDERRVEPTFGKRPRRLNAFARQSTSWPATRSRSERPETLVTFCTGPMGNTFGHLAGGVDASSEERRVGKQCVSKYRSQGPPSHKNTKKNRAKATPRSN